MQPGSLHGSLLQWFWRHDLFWKRLSAFWQMSALQRRQSTIFSTHRGTQPCTATSQSLHSMSTSSATYQNTLNALPLSFSHHANAQDKQLPNGRLLTFGRQRQRWDVWPLIWTSQLFQLRRRQKASPRFGKRLWAAWTPGAISQIFRTSLGSATVSSGPMILDSRHGCSNHHASKSYSTFVPEFPFVNRSMEPRWEATWKRESQSDKQKRALTKKQLTVRNHTALLY